VSQMIVTGWWGGGYGLRLTRGNRDEFLQREWKHLVLELEGLPTPIEVNIDKPSFWDGTCYELVKKEIGEWLISNGLAPWPKRHPPKLRMEHISGNRFFVHKENLAGRV